MSANAKEVHLLTDQTYPGAKRSRWYQDNYPGAAMNPDKGVIHTTEGASLPTYSSGAVAPNITAKPSFKHKRLNFWQHFPMNRSARALQNHAGGVETNTDDAIQIELVGTCSKRTSRKWTKAGIEHIYWPEAPDWAIRDLAHFIAWCHTEHGVEMKADGIRFLPYPDSYGSSSGQRMSNRQWRRFKGWCGHQHVPENDHGDPGALPIDRVLSIARKVAAPPKPKPEPKPKPKPKRHKVKYVRLKRGVKFGRHNRQVVLLQRLLTKAGYGHLPGTTYYGPQTRAAVRRFHEANPRFKAHRNRPDGHIGRKGFKHLQWEARHRAH